MKKLLIYFLDLLTVLLVSYFILSILKSAKILPEFTFIQSIGFTCIALLFKVPTKYKMCEFEKRKENPTDNDYIKYCFVKAIIMSMIYGAYLLLSLFI